MLRALAASPAGLTTPQLAELASSGTSWVNALGSTRQLMLKQERLHRVEQAGIAPGNRTRGSVLWRITNEGRRHVREADAGAAPRPAPEWPTPEFITALLCEHGFTRSDWCDSSSIRHEQASTGFHAFKVWNRDNPGRPLTGIWPVVRDWPQCRREVLAMMERYAEPIRAAGYAASLLHRGGQPPWLIVTAAVLTPAALA